MQNINPKEELISIIVPVYNCQEYIEKSITSVKKQTYKNWELLVIENGEKGQAEHLCKDFRNDHIKYLYDQIPSVSNARNIGIQYSTGSYIAFIDSDDSYENNFLEEMIQNIKENNL